MARSTGRHDAQDHSYEEGSWEEEAFGTQGWESQVYSKDDAFSAAPSEEEDDEYSYEDEEYEEDDSEDDEGTYEEVEAGPSFKDRLAGFFRRKESAAASPRVKPQREKTTRVKPERKDDRRSMALVSDGDDAHSEELQSASAVVARERHSVFAIEEEEDDFFKRQDELFQEGEKLFVGQPLLEAQNSRVQDILKLLDIPETFVIGQDVFLPEDLSGITFDTQAPYGYEMGQVTSFMEKTRRSLEHLVQLLTLRNEHVAQLATAVDKLQVDNNNLKYEAEIANGISIMPTSSAEDLEDKYTQAMIAKSALEERVRLLEQALDGRQMPENFEARMNELRDQISVLRRENENFKQDNTALKMKLAAQDEETVTELDSLGMESSAGGIAPSAQGDLPLPALPMGGLTPRAPKQELPATLPAAPVTPPASSRSEAKTSPASAFFLEDEEEDEGTSTFSPVNLKEVAPVKAPADNGEDQLDLLMKNWGSNG